MVASLLKKNQILTYLMPLSVWLDATPKVT